MRRRTAFALAAAAVALGLWVTFRSARPQPESFTIDESLPAGAVRRIGSRMFGRVGGPNRRLVELSPDGARVYVCDDDGFLRAWDTERGAPVWQIAAHADAVPPSSDGLGRRLDLTWRAWSGAWHSPPRDLAVAPDGSRLATCAAAMIRVFDAETGRFVAEHRTERDVDAIAWTADGRRLLRADHDRIAAWDVDEDTEVLSEPFANAHLAFAVRPDGIVAVRGSSNSPGPATLLDGTTLARAGENPPPPDKWNPMFRFDTRGRELVVQWPTPEQRKWTWAWFDPASGALGDTFRTEGFVARILEPEAGRQVVVVAGPSALELVTVADGSATRLTTGSMGTEGATLARNRRRVAWAAHGRARVHDVALGRRLHADELLVAPESWIVLPDGVRLLAPSDDASLVEIEIATGRVLRRFDVTGVVMEAPILSADGRYVGVPTSRGVCRVDLTTGAVSSWTQWIGNLVFRGHDVIGLRWEEQIVCVVDAATGAVTQLEHGATSSLGDVTWSDDGTRLRADVQTGTYVWDTTTGRVVDERLPTPPRLRLADAPSGGGHVFQDVGPRCAQVALRDRIDPDGVHQGVLAQGAALGTTLVAFPQNPTGARRRRTREAQIVLVAADDGRTVARLTAADGPVTRLAFVPGGRWLVSGHGDGTILVWDLTALPPR